MKRAVLSLNCRARRPLLAGAGALALYLACPFRPVVIHGRSMVPTLRDGQLCLMRRVGSAGPLRRGDVILFR